jgi:hypothetical protein
MKYVVLLVLGLLLGAGVAVFFLGVPRAKSAPGARVQAPTSAELASDTVMITVGNGFFNDLLTAVFRDLGPPAFNLAELETGVGVATVKPIAFQQGCANSITVMSEGTDSKTQVQFTGGKITAPLAFTGSYNLMGNCMQFKGWASTSIDLRFDQAAQTVYGQVNVDGVNLEGVNPIANNFVTVFVRNAIDTRVNPLELIRAPQLQLLIPVKASNGSVTAIVKDVRAEVKDGALKLYISYEFNGAKGENRG